MVRCAGAEEKRKSAHALARAGNRGEYRGMTVVYVLAHFDDEYCAMPLIRRAVAEGRQHLFVHVVD